MSDNPYLPPKAETDVPDAPQSHGWFVRDGHLHVETNAQLPMVDLFSGETADRMILHSMKVTRYPLWLTTLSWTTMGLVLLSFATPLAGITGPLAFVTGMAAAIGAILTRSFKLGAMFTHKSSRKINFLSRVGSILGFILLLLFFAQFGISILRSDETRAAIGIVFVTLLVLRLLMPFFFKRLTCRRSFGSHFEIRGVHPVALEQLLKLSQG